MKPSTQAVTGSIYPGLHRSRQSVAGVWSRFLKPSSRMWLLSTDRARRKNIFSRVFAQPPSRGAPCSATGGVGNVATFTRRHIKRRPSPNECTPECDLSSQSSPPRKRPSVSFRRETPPLMRNLCEVFYVPDGNCARGDSRRLI